MNGNLEQARDLFLAGLGHFAAGRFQAAETGFVSSLALVPGRPSTLLNLGATRLRLGEPAAALVALDEALAVAPGDLDARSHRGVALAELGRFDEAVACHGEVLAVAPSRTANRLHRGRALNALGRHEEALGELDRVIVAEPGHADAWFRRGQTLQWLDRHDEALAAYEQAVGFDPAHAEAWTNRGSILRDSGRLEAAAVAYEQAIANGGDPVLNGYFLAAVAGRRTPASPPPAYVEPLFDDYADTFEQHAVHALHYRAHRVLVEHLAALPTSRGPRHFAAALDLGCGTGLCGPLLRPLVDVLEGVDLSARMLDKARALGVYDRLVHADVAAHLQATTARYDLVLAADVFIYVGDLEAVFAGVRRVVTPDAVFCFSLEAADDAHDYRLLSSLRYSHSERHVRELAARHGFAVAQVLREPLREDQGRPVPGLYVVLVPQAAEPAARGAEPG